MENNTGDLHRKMCTMHIFLCISAISFSVNVLLYKRINLFARFCYLNS
jgi:hypothetical protein